MKLNNVKAKRYSDEDEKKFSVHFKYNENEYYMLFEKISGCYEAKSAELAIAVNESYRKDLRVLKDYHRCIKRALDSLIDMVRFADEQWASDELLVELDNECLSFNLQLSERDLPLP